MPVPFSSGIRDRDSVGGKITGEIITSQLLSRVRWGWQIAMSRHSPNQLVRGPGAGLAGPGAAGVSHSLGKGNLGVMLEVLPDSLLAGDTARGRDLRGQLVCVEASQRLRRMRLCFLRFKLARCLA